MPTTPSKKSAVKGGSLEVVDRKNIHIPLYDAGGGKVLLAYYAEGRSKLVKCRNQESARKENG